MLRGLEEGFTEEDIKRALQEEYNLPVRDVISMKANYNVLYLIVTNSDITIKSLSHSIKFLLNTKIS